MEYGILLRSGVASSFGVAKWLLKGGEKMMEQVVERFYGVLASVSEGAGLAIAVGLVLAMGIGFVVSMSMVSYADRTYGQHERKWFWWHLLALIVGIGSVGILTTLAVAVRSATMGH